MDVINKLTLNPYSDYIPLLSSAISLRDLFYKYAPIPNLEGKLDKHYFNYLQNRSTLRSVVLLVPLLGNITVYLFDRFLESLKQQKKKLEIPSSPPTDPLLPSSIPITPPHSPGSPPHSPGSPPHSPGSPPHSPGSPPHSPPLPPVDVIVVEIDLPEVARSLKEWKSNPAETGMKEVAASRILAAARTRSTELDLSQLGLKTLPPALGMLTQLTKLKLTLNELSSLPDEVAQLVNLEQLELDNNSFTNCPDVICQLKKLTHLWLTENKIEDLPKEFGKLANLQELYLDSNHFTVFPKEIFELSNLKCLWLNGNQLFSLPVEIGNLTKLTMLNLENNQFSNFPEEICQLKNLATLWLNGNQLQELTAKIGALKNLTELQLNSNKLTALPKEVGQLLKLKLLGLENNRIVALPTEIGALAMLSQLWLKENKLAALPAEIGQLKNLTLLNLAENELTQLPAEIGRLNSLKDIGLYQNKLTSLPVEMARLSNLTALWLVEGKRAPLPLTADKCANFDLFLSFEDCITKWKNDPTVTGDKETAAARILAAYRTKSKSLNLSGLWLTTLPPQIGRLTTLEKLELKENLLSTLPNEIGQLTNLTELWLSTNQLITLPSTIGNLTNLLKLDLNTNQLNVLPGEIGNLTKLQTFSLERNQFVTLPSTIGQLTSLTKMWLNRNQLLSLPLELRSLSKLETLLLSDNPNLRELPLSLGQIQSLTEIDIHRTGVSTAVRDSILYECRVAKRAEGTRAVLAARLDKWKMLAGSKIELTGIESLTDAQMKTIITWMNKLEATPDFKTNQATLAKIICSMVPDVFKNKEFQELFITQAEANNESCEDRAAMSLNEIYSTWNLLCKSAGLPLKEKLKLMTGVAKTVRLRKELAKQIGEREELESVEIFLYFESLLSKRLQLVTAIQTMAHTDIGKRSWIDVDKLVDEVKNHFFEELAELPIFEKTMLADPAMKEKLDKINSDLADQLEALGDCPEGDDFDTAVLDYQVKQGEYDKAWRERKFQAAKAWYESHLS